MVWTLGDRVRKAVSVANIPASKLADMLGVTRVTVSRWMNDATVPAVKHVNHIALITGVPVEWIMTGQLNEYPPSPDGERGNLSSLLPDSNRRPFHYNSPTGHQTYYGDSAEIAA